MAGVRQGLGDRGELLAEQFLATRGYTVLARKYRCREGEIDLVCRDGETLTFVEVKTRRGSAFGAPEEAVTSTKLAHLECACHHYLQAHSLEEEPWRIDVVAIAMDRQGRVLDVRLITDAAEW